MAKTFLEIKDLHGWYGESHVLHGVNLKVDEGEVVTLLGRNGAGRTSTLRAILGLIGSRKGSIKVLGQETIGMAPHRIARLGLGYCPGGARHLLEPLCGRKPDAAAAAR
jgi:branched-chain amino acid transport system ATP-binding protein